MTSILLYSNLKLGKYPIEDAIQSRPGLASLPGARLFEGEAAMDAENARIQAETRELVKRRPYGPWLFR
jgi:hypothetical protein